MIGMCVIDLNCVELLLCWSSSGRSVAKRDLGIKKLDVNFALRVVVSSRFSRTKIS